MSVVVEMGKFTNVTTGFAIKETPASPNAHIVIGTAGTLLDQLSKGTIDPRKLKVFVLDEADNMLEKGTLGDQTLRVKKSVFYAKTRRHLILIPHTVGCPKPSRRFFSLPHSRVMSAVLPPSSRHARTRSCSELRSYPLKELNNSTWIARPKSRNLKCLCKSTHCSLSGRASYLCRYAQAYPDIIQYFLTTWIQRRSTADSVAARMIAEGHKVTSLTGTHQSGDRDQTFDDFREGRTKVLITTNVVARGIDILQVNLVVNYDLPLNVNGEPDVETYLHRIGEGLGVHGEELCSLTLSSRSDWPIWTKRGFYQLRA